MGILADFGLLAASILEKPDLIGKHVGQASLFPTADELAEILSKGSGKTVTANCPDWETFAGFGFPGADELAQMFESWFRMHDKFTAARDPATQKEIMGADFTDPVEYVKTLPLLYK